MDMPTLIVEDAPLSTKLSLTQGDSEIAHLFVIPFRIRVGQAIAQVDGIGDVWTDEAHRNRGHARRLLEEAVRQMRAGDGALSLLYGIPDFYGKFGYAVAGPEQLLVLDELQRAAPLPAGWQVRRATMGDLPAIQALYNLAAVDVVGSAVRDQEASRWSGRAWTLLAAALGRDDGEECRVVEAADGHIAASCWRGAEAAWFVAACEGWSPETMAFAEVLADSLPAAEAALAACRAWALEAGARRERPITSVTLGVPLGGFVSRAAAFGDARRIHRHHRTGGFMARVLDSGRLLAQLLPELEARLRHAGVVDGSLCITGEEGDVTLQLSAGALTIIAAGEASSAAVALPQAALAQLALGAFPPQDVLARLHTPPELRASEWLCALFPKRQPHLFPADRP
jgi:hypothetical protein